MSISNLLTTQYSSTSGFNKYSKSYKNVKAIPAFSKNFSKFFNTVNSEGDHEGDRKYFFEINHTPSAVSSKPLYCFFSSYLHLFQLF